MLGCLSSDPAAIDWRAVRAQVVAHGSHTLAAVPARCRPQIAQEAAQVGLWVRVVGNAVLRLELAVGRKGGAPGPRLPRQCRPCPDNVAPAPGNRSPGRSQRRRCHPNPSKQEEAE